MLDHLSLSLTDAKRSQAFYVQALAPLGYRVVAQYEGGFGIGAEEGCTIWMATAPAPKPIAHLAFRAHDRRQVDAFYQAAMAAGGRDNGKPGLRGAPGGSEPHWAASGGGGAKKSCSIASSSSSSRRA
jgi:catechol 2,3-dioxygenase-like lactoylglutathione lyase family enzyme